MSHSELPLFYVFHFYLFGIIAVRRFRLTSIAAT